MYFGGSKYVMTLLLKVADLMYFPLSTNQSRPLLKNQWLLFIFSLIVQSLLHYLQYNIGGCVGVVWSLAAHKPQQRQHGLQVINAEPWAPVQTYQLESAF